MIKIDELINKLDLEAIKTNKGYLEDSPLMLELSLNTDKLGDIELFYITIIINAGGVIDFRGEPLVVINQFELGDIFSYQASNKLLEGAYLKDYIKMLEIALEISKEFKDIYIPYSLKREEGLTNGIY
jgi:hypothetical protein